MTDTKSIPNMAPGAAQPPPAQSKAQATNVAASSPGPTPTPQQKAVAPIDQFRGALMKMEDQFQMVLPPQIKPERFLRVVMTAVQQNPELLAADRSTLFSASMKAATDGLIPDGKEAALVTFGNKVQYMPMVAGILKKVRNSGELSSITALDIYEKDDFKYWIDSDGEHLTHKPLMFGDKGKLLGTYALAKTKDGAVYIEVMDMSQLDAVKKVSRGKTGPWSGDFAGEMRKKSAIRRLSKRLPMSTDIEMVIQRDDDLFTPSESQPEAKVVSEEPPPPPPEVRKSRLKTAIESQSPPIDVTPTPQPQTPDEDIPI